MVVDFGCGKGVVMLLVVEVVGEIGWVVGVDILVWMFVCVVVMLGVMLCS